MSKQSTPTFNMGVALQGLREGKNLIGKDGILTPLIKQLTEAAMQVELENHLASETTPNRKRAFKTLCQRISPHRLM